MNPNYLKFITGCVDGVRGALNSNADVCPEPLLAVPFAYAIDVTAGRDACWDMQIGS